MGSRADLPGKHRTVLIVEDEYFLAADLAAGLSSRGATVVGPAPSVAAALGIVGSSSQIDTAVLDINLRGEPVFGIADALERRGVPFIFVTGYERSMVPARFASVPLFQKPVDTQVICTALLG